MTQEILRTLRKLGNKENRAGMARFGITTENAYGISIPTLRRLAKKIGTNHRVALQLWKSPIHEAKLLAVFIDDPAEITERQMDRWVRDFDSWDVCDQCCGFLFDKTPYAYKKAIQWSKRREEFVKRAGFTLMASLSVHDKNAKNEMFLKFLPRIRMESGDERNFVRKGVNWALRQIGKRNAPLNAAAVKTGRRISRINSRSARWIAADALRELTGAKLRKRLKIANH